MPWPFNILAPITLGRKGAKGDTGESGTPAPANTWENLTGKPSTFPPASHTHAISETTGLQTALNGKANIPTGPYDNDYIAKGCAYAALGPFNFWRTTPGPNPDGYTISMQEAVSPNFTPRIDALGPEGLSIIVFYATDSTNGDVISLIDSEGASYGIGASLPATSYSQLAVELEQEIFGGGSLTPYVSVGSLYYTADGSAKRRMS